MRISRRQLWVTCLAIGIAVPTVATVEANATADRPAGLTTTVQIGTATSDALTVRFTARNTSSSTVNVLSRDLPQARQSGAILTVTLDGAPVPYRGKIVKYAAPTVADYTRIPAGGTYAATVNLADDYDLSRPGTYTVALASTQVRAMRGATAGLQDTVRVKAGRGTVRTDIGIQGSGKPSRTNVAPTTTEQVETVAPYAVRIAFLGCSSSEKSALRKAVRDAAKYSKKSEAWLASHPSGGGAYKTWFGSYNSSRFEHVTSVFSRVTGELQGKTLTLDCTSDAPYMAYVFGDDHYHIYLCPGYWPAPAKGYDSKAGTLIHESSHFNVNGGADDWVYGLDEGKQLARSNPGKAVDNADNIEHFAESL
ncbi:M35 family metallo-endopeptidase [Streptomyces sp. NPDC002668]|uniref:M35 family metallo-endopeptidase n=1 Tax=Streptomyces sp. NPDC002668 TaxID=3154422 RepID=UPI00332C338D